MKSLIFLLILLSVKISFAQLSIFPSPSSGVIDLSTNSEIIIQFVNSGTSDQPMSLSMEAITDNTNGFSIKIDRCSGKTLKKTQSCYAVVLLEKSALAFNSQRLVSLKNGSSSLFSLKGLKITPSSAPAFSASVSSLDFGTLVDNTRSSSPKNVIVTNTGTAKGSPIIVVPNGVSLSLNRCSTGIEPGKSCSLSFVFKSLISLVPQSGTNYSGNILIKNSPTDSSPISISIGAILATYCSTGFEYSFLISSCVDMRPQLAEINASFTNPTAFPVVPNPQTLGIFTSTMNGAMDLTLFKKDPKGGTLSYQISTGSALNSLTPLTQVTQSALTSYPPNNTQYYYYPTIIPYTTSNPYFRLFFPYDSSAGTKNIFIKVTATSSLSGFSNSIIFSSSYQNDLKFPYLTAYSRANNSQETIHLIQPSLTSNAGNAIAGYRDILYVDPAKNSIKFKFHIPDSDVVNSYASNDNTKTQISISDYNPSSNSTLLGANLYAMYEYDSVTSIFSRYNSLDEPQVSGIHCDVDPASDGAYCAIARPNLANDLNGKIIQVKIRLLSPETRMARAVFFNYLVLNSLNGTPCSSPADPNAAPFHGIKVSDLNGDGIIESTDIFAQICTAAELKSFAFSNLISPLGNQRRLSNFSLESDIDMTPYYSAGGVKFTARQFSGIFKGNNHKISNFIIDVNNATKNIGVIGSNEAATPANYPVGAGTYTGTNSQANLGFINQVFGGSIYDLTLENIKVVGTGWTNVGTLAGQAWESASSIPNGRVDVGSMTTDNNYGITYNEFKNVHITSTGNDTDGHALSRVKGSSNVGGLVGSIAGDVDGSNIRILPFKISQSSVDKIFVDSNNTFTQGAVLLGGLIGESRKAELNQISLSNIDLRDISSSATSFIGGMSGYNHYSNISNIKIDGIKLQANATSLQMGGLIGVENGILTSSPLTYYPSRSSVSNIFINFDASSSNWSLSGQNLSLGRLYAGLRHADLFNSVAIGTFNPSTFVSSYSSSVNAGTIAAYVDHSEPTPATVTNVEVDYQTFSASYVKRCGSTDAICDSNPEIIPANYFTGYFYTLGSSGSPAVQSWDFTNIWRSPISSENVAFPYLR